MRPAKDLMSPDASPSSPSGKSGGRRVNNIPIYILVGGLAIFLVIMALVAYDRGAQRRQPATGTGAAHGGETSMFANAVIGEQKDGIVKARMNSPSKAAEAQQAAGSMPAVPVEGMAVPPVPGPPMPQQSAAQQQERSQRDDEAARIRSLKLQQFDEAVRAKTSVPVALARGGTAGNLIAQQADLPAIPTSRDDALARIAAVRQQIEATMRDDPGAAYKARLQLVNAAGAGGGLQDSRNGQAGHASANARGSDGLASFASNTQGDRWRLESRPEAPQSPYQLRAGFVVPAILISGVNSELPGQIVAQVSQDVYDTPLGAYKLIPQGSRLVGSYASEAAYGQSRLLIAWQRIVFPDGKAMDIGAMPGADSAGYAGFKDQVNNHYFRLFSSAFLMSGVTAGIAMSQPDRKNDYARPSTSSALSEALGQQLGQVTAQLIAKNLNIAPTLEIRPGYRFNVIVTKDMTFSKPYVAFDY